MSGIEIVIKRTDAGYVAHIPGLSQGQGRSIAAALDEAVSNLPSPVCGGLTEGERAAATPVTYGLAVVQTVLAGWTYARAERIASALCR